MEMHMVCINSKYIESNGTLNDEYLTAEDGVAVLGFMFSIGEKVLPYVVLCPYITNFSTDTKHCSLLILLILFYFLELWTTRGKCENVIEDVDYTVKG